MYSGHILTFHLCGQSFSLSETLWQNTCITNPSWTSVWCHYHLEHVIVIAKRPTVPNWSLKEQQELTLFVIIALTHATMNLLLFQLCIKHKASQIWIITQVQLLLPAYHWRRNQFWESDCTMIRYATKLEHNVIWKIFSPDCIHWSYFS